MSVASSYLPWNKPPGDDGGAVLQALYAELAEVLDWETVQREESQVLIHA